MENWSKRNGGFTGHPRGILRSICAGAVFAFSVVLSVMLCFLYFDILSLPSSAILLRPSAQLVISETTDVRFSEPRKTAHPVQAPSAAQDLAQDSAESPIAVAWNESGEFQTTPVLNDTILKSIGERRTVAGSDNRDQEAAGKEAQRNHAALGNCDFTVGTWVRDDSYPLYQSKNCPFIDDGFRCLENGRPDGDFMKWRWQPSGCDLPRFNATYFLEKIRNDRVVFVGDSIGRNQWESLVCMMAEAIPDKSRIYEVNGNPITKHRGFLSFRFKDYNCTVEYYRSPFLVYQGRPPGGSGPQVITTLKTDMMDYTSKLWRNAGILIFNTGHWWNYEKTIRGGCYFEKNKRVDMNMSLETAFKRSMRTWIKWVEANVDSDRNHVFFRSYSPVHFRDGTWKTGGQCHKENWPEFNTSNFEEERETDRLMLDLLAEHDRAKHVQFLNISYLTQFRKDGHASIYYLGNGSGPASIRKQDCSHWCLPGVPDVWNHLIYSYLFSRWNG